MSSHQTLAAVLPPNGELTRIILIHENQSRYMPGRNICENLCSIIDLMAYTKDKSEPGISVFIDFETACLEC